MDVKHRAMRIPKIARVEVFSGNVWENIGNHWESVVVAVVVIKWRRSLQSISVIDHQLLSPRYPGGRRRGTKRSMKFRAKED